LVIWLQPGTRVNLIGCANGRHWCDVVAGRARKRVIENLFARIATLVRRTPAPRRSATEGAGTAATAQQQLLASAYARR
jgi:uncharacterized protein YraI